LGWCVTIFGAGLVIHALTLALPENMRYYTGPSAWCFFLLGHVSHRVSDFIKSPRVRKNLAFAGLVIVLLAALLSHVWQYEVLDRPGLWAFFVLFAVAVPYWFDLTRDNRVDNAIGGLSYPIYLVHVPAIAIAAHIFGGNENEIYKLGFWICSGIVVAVLLAAVALHLGLERPIDRIRWQFRAGSPPATSTA